jgi:hypothetical protein
MRQVPAMKKQPKDPNETAVTSLARLTLVAPAFVGELLLPALAVAPGLAITALSAPRPLVRQYLTSSTPPVDAAVTLGDEPTLPPRWSTVHVGEIAYGLFTSPRVAGSLGSEPSADDVQDLRFVALVYVTSKGDLLADDDRCPLPREERWITHEVDDVRVACRLAAETDRLFYGLSLAAAPFVRDGALVEVPIRGWSRVDSVQLVCDGERVPAPLQTEIADALRLALGKTLRTSAVVSAAEKQPSGRKRRSSKTG